MKRLAIVTGLAAVAAALAVVYERNMLAAPHYRGAESDHFDGSDFTTISPGGRPRPRF